MNTTTIERPTTRRTRAPGRIDRSTIVLTGLSVVFALLVLLQMLPGTDGADAAGSTHVGSTLTLPLFITGALVSVVAIAALLVRATRREL